MHRVLLLLAVALFVIAGPCGSRAGLLGDEIQGELQFPALTGDQNLFDPSNGLVPLTGVNPDQPSATVIDPDDAYPEFQMYASSSTNGLEVDVDDTTIQIKWYSGRNSYEWVGHRIRLFDLDLGEGLAIQNVVEHQNDASARVSWDARSITVETEHYAVMTHITKPSYLLLSIETAVPAPATSFSRIKAFYR